MSEEIAQAEYIAKLYEQRQRLLDLLHAAEQERNAANERERIAAETYHAQQSSYRELEGLYTSMTERAQRAEQERDAVQTRLTMALDMLHEAERERNQAEADALEARNIFAWMVSFNDAAMITARTLHYDMRGKAQQWLALRSPGAALLSELAALRELRDDVVRWRDGGGDVRDIGYILETIERIEKGGVS